MTMRLIPHAEAMVEFIVDPVTNVRYTGTCGEDAGLALAHVIDPAKWPLNAATLAAITRWEIGQHQASANGSEPLSSIASWLETQGIHYTNYGYSNPPTFDWRGILNQWGGIKPLTFEFSHTSAGLVGDEAGVAFHFNTCLGWDPIALVGLFADGDNIIERSGGTGLARYTLAELEAAGVCGLIVGEYELGAAMTTIPTGWKDDGSTLTAPNGIPVDHAHGFRDIILNHPGGWRADDWPEEAEQAVDTVEIAHPSRGAGVIQVFRFSQLAWTRATAAYQVYVGAEVMKLRANYAALQAELTPLQASLQSAQQQATSAQANATAMQTQRDALSQQLQTAQAQNAALNTQLQAAQVAASTPPPPTQAEVDALAAVAAIKKALGD